MDAAAHAPEYKNVLLFLATAAILVPLFQRFRTGLILKRWNSASGSVRFWVS